MGLGPLLNDLSFPNRSRLFMTSSLARNMGMDMDMNMDMDMDMGCLRGKILSCYPTCLCIGAYV